MIDVMIVSLRPGRITPYTFRSVLKQPEVSSVIVVTPTDEMDEFARSFESDKIVVVREPPNFCLAWARRLGVNYAKSKYVCYVDDDVILGDGFFKPFLKKAEELEKQYPAFGIEGIMHLMQYGSDKPILYKEQFLKPGDRGFTHNTLLLRESLLSWRPIYTFAWEDWHLTQHIFSLGGVWLRMKTPVVTYHYHSYATWKRQAWNTAGERMVKGLGLRPFFRRAIRLTYVLVRQIFTKRSYATLVNNSHRLRGYVVGYLKCGTYLNRPA
ncbi:MAG: glycosyltransferase family 2 protein [Candidatus Thorarchaeota archaeon]